MCYATKTRFLVFISLLFVLSACVPLAKPATSTVSVTVEFSTATPSIPTKPIRATSTPLPAVTLEPTSTKIHLPFNDEVGNREYCEKSPSLELRVSDAQKLSEDEIAEKLVSLFFDYYTAPQVPDWCRVEGYQIDKVSQLEPGKSGPLEPKGDFLRKVLFSIKLIQINSVWIAYPGEIDQQNWLHTGRVVAITKTLNLNAEEIYKMEFANP